MDANTPHTDLISTSSGVTLKDIGNLAATSGISPRDLYLILQILGSAKLAYSYQQAAEATGAGLSTIKQAVKDGEIPVALIGPKKSKPIIAAPDLAAWISAHALAA